MKNCWMQAFRAKLKWTLTGGQLQTKLSFALFAHSPAPGPQERSKNRQLITVQRILIWSPEIRHTRFAYLPIRLVTRQNCGEPIASLNSSVRCELARRTFLGNFFVLAKVTLTKQHSLGPGRLRKCFGPKAKNKRHSRIRKNKTFGNAFSSFAC